MVDTVTALDHAVIELCADWQKVAECPTGTLEAVIRNRELGEWRIESALTPIVMQSGYTIDGIDTVRLVAEDRILFAGYVTPAATGNPGGLEVTGAGADQHVTLTGPDAWAALAGRVAYPSPATEPPWADSHDLRTGVASTVAAGYLSANLGPTALAARQFPDVSIADGLAGTTGSWSARLQRLDELVGRICRDGGIVCRVTVDFAGALRIYVGGATDRSASTVISDQGDLLNIRRRLAPATVTDAIVGGQGELTARTFARAGTGTGAARREAFGDQTSLATATEVQQAATTLVAFGGPTWAISAEIAPAAAQRFQYLDNYDIGDTISAEIGNVRHAVPIESVRFSIGPDLKVIRPILGDAVPNELAGLIRDVRGLQSRFDSQVA